MYSEILPHPLVLYVDRGQKNAREELLVPGHNLFINKFNVLRAYKPDLDGKGRTVSLKENLFDTADVDLKNRWLISGHTSDPVRTHAGVMATLIAGAGNAGPDGQGVAPGARLIHGNFNPILPDSNVVYARYGVSVQNHSYGVDIEPYYGPDAQGFDQSVRLRPVLLHVFSAGNSGLQTASTGRYAQIARYANLTGSFKMAKNVLLVGAVDSFGVPAFFSSRGPAYDGRLKPDLVAFGQDGSSGAAALVSGTALILQQVYAGQHNGVLPPAAWARALLINGADDAGPKGIDYTAGYGNLNAPASVQMAMDGRYKVDSITSQAQNTWTIAVPPQTSRLKVTLTWDDVPALAGATKALLNDLDLAILAPSGQKHYPWVLNTAPNADSLALPAVKGRDTLNTVEQVEIDHPVAGLYSITVQAGALATVVQTYSLAYDWTIQDTLRWTSPLPAGPIHPNDTTVLRWESSLSAQTGRLEYRRQDSAWVLIDSVVNLTGGTYRWRVPAVFSEARMRMVAGGRSFISDTFLIAPTLNLKIGFDCPDSTMLFWNSAAPGSQYALYGLGDRYLEKLLTTFDTFQVLPKLQYPQVRYAVAPLGISGKQGSRSTAPDIGQQGVGCYFQTFLAELTADGSIAVALETGTAYGLLRMVIESWDGIGFHEVQAMSPVVQTTMEYKEQTPSPGIHRFRARLQASNGAVFYSDVALVYVPGREGWLVFPNPVSGTEALSVVTDSPGDTTFRLWDSAGRLIVDQLIDDVFVTVPLQHAPAGVYWFSLRRGGEQYGGKILVR
jgi:hypothetical protein